MACWAAAEVVTGREAVQEETPLFFALGNGWTRKYSPEAVRLLQAHGALPW